jgi:hypothetical protein
MNFACCCVKFAYLLYHVFVSTQQTTMSDSGNIFQSTTLIRASATFLFAIRCSLPLPTQQLNQKKKSTRNYTSHHTPVRHFHAYLSCNVSSLCQYPDCEENASSATTKACDVHLCKGFNKPCNDPYLAVGSSHLCFTCQNMDNEAYNENMRQQQQGQVKAVHNAHTLMLGYAGSLLTSCCFSSVLDRNKPSRMNSVSMMVAITARVTVTSVCNTLAPLASRRNRVL